MPFSKYFLEINYSKDYNKILISSRWNHANEKSKKNIIKISFEEYNKLFILFAQNYNIRGRDPSMLISLVDSVIHVNTPNRTFQQFHYLSAAIGTFDFSNVSRRASDALTTVNFRSETNDMFIGDMFIRESGMKAEPIINIGGFDVLFEMTEQEIKDKLYEKDLILEFEKKVIYEN